MKGKVKGLECVDYLLVNIAIGSRGFHESSHESDDISTSVLPVFMPSEFLPFIADLIAAISLFRSNSLVLSRNKCLPNKKNFMPPICYDLWHKRAETRHMRTRGDFFGEQHRNKIDEFVKATCLVSLIVRSSQFLAKM